MRFTFELDDRLIIKHLDDLVEALQRELAAVAPRISELVLKNVLDNNNWNPKARYSPNHPLAGQRYDLAFSGQLRSTIASPELNYIKRARGTPFEIGIGNISALDSLQSQNGGPGPYWRFAVFGHRAPHRKGPHTFVETGTELGKPVGYVVPFKENMRGTPPTYMFKNGLFVSEQGINSLVTGAISKASEEVARRWR